MSITANRLLLSFYGDDFTGSTDALEFLSKAGIKTMLFISAPSKEQLQQYPDLQAIGIAGMSRTMSPKAMEATLKPAFEALKAINPEHVHYKICSTFDSSPERGNIGIAIKTGQSVFKTLVPLVVAAPALGRYCTFGNLYARMGIGSQGQIYRLDRHPSMSKHPTTPATESDLRLHLAKQSTVKTGLLDILDIAKESEQRKEKLHSLIAEGNEVILFDAIDATHMESIGELLANIAPRDHPLFSVGSSGIEMALGLYWNRIGRIKNKENWPQPSAVKPLLVVSGSCSPVTAQQINQAVAIGFEEIALDTVAIAKQQDEEILKVITKAVTFLRAEKNVVIHTSKGPDDERLANTGKILKQDEQLTSASLLGTVLGNITRAILEEVKLPRLLLAGGDTSSYAARALGIEAVEMIAPLSPGAPLCKAYAPNSPADGIEINFKGGQVGAPNYFEHIQSGKIS
ncbi:four-carbon acid sugar kinase family protein [Pedobacter glucosidilyticus]|uniref:four-carbon acid sugar kinase family protein n=1 Tax=Pedobacter glucosidilyticus TaxID=1122941 RepID=UPI0026EF0AFB|nr:four-carbon acid sugar kinase family protein [Pedobacter glucosidilyticus]